MQVYDVYLHLINIRAMLLLNLIEGVDYNGKFKMVAKNDSLPDLS